MPRATCTQRLFDETGTVPAVNQIEVHPEHQQAEASAFGIEHGGDHRVVQPARERARISG